MTGMGVPGVEDVAALARWLRARDVTAEGGMPEVRLIAGGRSNLTYRLDFPPAGSASAAGSGAGAATATGAATAAGSGAAAGVATAAGAASAAAAAPGSSPDAPRPLVLRRPPLGHVLPTAHDMGREFRVLSALHGTAVPVPRPLALCEDESVIGAPFYVMEWVDGVVLRTREDAEAITPAQATEISQRFITMLATIHGVDLGAVGLEKFGRPEGYLARQLARWQRQWELSVTREVPGYDELVQRLAAGLPASGATRATSPPRATSPTRATNAAGLPAANGGPAGTLVHGDFRIDNMLLTLGTGPAIAAVVDWEMSTLGDPLADLGLTLVYWIDPGEEDLLDYSGRGGLTAAPGFLKRADLAERYAEATGRDLSRLGYYMAFGCFKLAVVLEGIHARFLQHKTVGEGFDRQGEAVPTLIERAHRLLDTGKQGHLGGHDPG